MLELIKMSKDIKSLDVTQLNILAQELREEIIDTAKNNGGHLSSNLGVIETTVALYKVFDFPKDKIIFDVGHQCYAHKILSGRHEEFSTIRTQDGLSGFPDREESEFDAFTTGHAGTSIAGGLGLCEARDKLKQDYFVIDIVGDGSFVNGLNLEALTSSQTKPKGLIVILNDNEMSISQNRNGLYKLISKGTTKRSYIRGKKAIKKVFKNSFITRFLRRVRDFFKRLLNKNPFFEQFGFKYVGVVDGNNVKEMVNILERVKHIARNKAVLLHVKTTKGKGLASAEERADYFHGVGKNFENSSGVFAKTLGETMNRLIEKDKSIHVITAAMKDGVGLAEVEIAHPNNFTDVGIAEEYAVTLGAGMACGGLKPLVAIYSTFMQRAYDQILHDVCLQNLPVVFCLDRSGLVGADGKTHQGVFDLSYLAPLPNIKVFAPTNGKEFEKMLEYAFTLSCPVAIRYPNLKQEDAREVDTTDLMRFEKVLDGEQAVALCVGPRMLKLGKELNQASNGKIAVYNARCVKPLDTITLDNLKDKKIITLEENSLIGGFGERVCSYYASRGENVSVYSFGVQDKFVNHGSIDRQLIDNGLCVENILSKIQMD